MVWPYTRPATRRRAPVSLILISGLFFLGHTASFTHAQEDLATYRLTIQIHEAPQFDSYYLFYFANFELARDDDPIKNRTVTLLIPKTEEAIQGISAYPDNNTFALSMHKEDVPEGIRIIATTDSSGLQVRYYQLVQAHVLKNDDQLLTFHVPRVEVPLRGMTVAINWPNWKFSMHKIKPEGAEMIMNPMFESDPYKTVSYYWYLSAGDVEEKAIEEISVTLRSAATMSRITRNQSILIFAAVVCIPTAIFVITHPPKRGEIKEKKKFRITDERTRRGRIRSRRYKVR